MDNENIRLVEYIRKNLDDVAKYTAVAEESSELTQAAMKVLRAGKVVDNPTPVSITQATTNFEEEIVDLGTVLWVLGYDPEWVCSVIKNRNEKLKRWAERIAKENKDHGRD